MLSGSANDLSSMEVSAQVLSPRKKNLMQVKNTEEHLALTKRFEMHVTSLKENFKSHDPHQQRAEEIILVLEGNVEMLIGETYYPARAGDVLFAPTNVFHGLKNTGSGSCNYFAFQWE